MSQNAWKECLAWMAAQHIPDKYMNLFLMAFKIGFLKGEVNILSEYIREGKYLAPLGDAMKIVEELALEVEKEMKNSGRGILRQHGSKADEDTPPADPGLWGLRPLPDVQVPEDAG